MYITVPVIGGLVGGSSVVVAEKVVGKHRHNKLFKKRHRSWNLIFLCLLFKLLNCFHRT